MRLIDADVLQKKFEGLKEKDGHATGRNAYDLCAMLTEDAPTVDAVVLPCKLGDKAFWACRLANKVFPFTVDAFIICEDGLFVMNKNENVFPWKDCSLTREEAEAALAERTMKDA